MGQSSIERREKSVDIPDARKSLDFNLLRISPESEERGDSVSKKV